jgi:hypothetical protein
MESSPFAPPFFNPFKPYPFPAPFTFPLFLFLFSLPPPLFINLSIPLLPCYIDIFLIFK